MYFAVGKGQVMAAHGKIREARKVLNDTTSEATKRSFFK
jgi:hypothetical protein